MSAITKASNLFKELFSESVLFVNTHGYVSNIGEILFYDIYNII